MPSSFTLWRCNSCWQISRSDELLTAPNPFDPEADEIVGCPHCKEADDFQQTCDYPGCKKPVSSGTPMPDGGYVHRCLDHNPRRIGEIAA